MAYLGQRTFASFEKKSRGWGSIFDEEEEYENVYKQELSFSENINVENEEEAYQEGEPIIGSFANEMGQQLIPIIFKVYEPIATGDPKGIAFKNFLMQIFHKTEEEASAIIDTYVKDESGFWNHFYPVISAPRLIPAFSHASTYAFRITGKHRDDLLLEYYLIQATKNASVTIENNTQINNNLRLLFNLPSAPELLEELKLWERAKITENRKKVDQEYRTYDVPVASSTYVKPAINHHPPLIAPPFSPLENKTEPEKEKRPLDMSRKQRLIVFVEEDEYIDKTLVGNNELKKIVSEFLIQVVEDDYLEDSPPMMKPSLYSNYLSAQLEMIAQSELYEELNFVRDVYQQYWDHVWEIFRRSSDFDKIRRNSEQAEHNIGLVGGNNPSHRKESIDHDWPLLWKIIAKKSNDSVFTALRKEYPDIPFGNLQFKKMWERSGGNFYNISFGGLKLDGSEKMKGVTFMTDSDVVTMLNTQLLFPRGDISWQSRLSYLSKEKSQEEDITLAEELEAMVLRMELLKKTQNTVENKLIGSSYGSEDAIPLQGVLIADEVFFGENIPLSLYLIQKGPGSWKIIDFSNPIAHKQPTYSGTGKTDKEAITNALINFGQEATYPKGDILVRMPDVYGEQNRVKVHSTGKNWKQEMAGDLSLISTIAGLLGLILVFTPLAPLGAGLLFVAGVTGTGAAGLRISDRIEHETFELNADTMLDVIDIVTGFIVVGKVATTSFKVVNEASKGARMAVLVQGIETGADIASVVLIGNQYLQQLQDLQEEFDRKQIDQVTYEKRRQEILQQAALVGLLMLVGYAAPKLSKRFGVSRTKTKTDQDIQKETISEVESGKTKLKDYGEKKGNYTRPGNYGEMKMDHYFEHLTEINGKPVKLKRISKNRITDVDQSGHKGIDGVYENLIYPPPPKYIIAESKYGSSTLSKGAKDGPQMSDDWIEGSHRLDKAVGEEAAEQIRDEILLNPNNMQKVLINVSESGSIASKSLNSKGEITGNWP